VLHKSSIEKIENVKNILDKINQILIILNYVIKILLKVNIKYLMEEVAYLSKKDVINTIKNYNINQNLKI